jgi:hypothetical protein
MRTVWTLYCGGNTVPETAKPFPRSLQISDRLSSLTLEGVPTMALISQMHHTIHPQFEIKSFISQIVCVMPASIAGVQRNV